MLQDELKALFGKEFDFSDKVALKAARIITEKRIRAISREDARRFYWHICPYIADGENKGNEPAYTKETDDWICNCPFEVFRTDRRKICSHILAAMYVKHRVENAE